MTFYLSNLYHLFQGSILRQYREHKGFQRKDVLKKINLGNLVNVEEGRADLSTDKIIDLLVFFGLKLDEFYLQLEYYVTNKYPLSKMAINISIDIIQQNDIMLERIIKHIQELAEVSSKITKQDNKLEIDEKFFLLQILREDIKTLKKYYSEMNFSTLSLAEELGLEDDMQDSEEIKKAS